MPKLSSAETPPEKSSDCLPVSTIAESGVITSTPLVCMSMVASAFQYGCAPTLMPATTTLISPPAWVNRTMRFNARPTQSRFSVPESIEIFAPADSANHSSGTCIFSARSSAAMTRAHSGPLSAPGHALGVALGRGADHTGDDRGLVAARRPVHRNQLAAVVEVVLDERTVRARQHAGQLVRIRGATSTSPQHPLRVVVQRGDRLG